MSKFNLNILKLDYRPNVQESRFIKIGMYVIYVLFLLVTISGFYLMNKFGLL